MHCVAYGICIIPGEFEPQPGVILVTFAEIDRENNFPANPHLPRIQEGLLYGYAGCSGCTLVTYGVKSVSICGSYNVQNTCKIENSKKSQYQNHNQST